MPRVDPGPIETPRPAMRRFTEVGPRQRWVDKDGAHDVEACGLLRHEWPGAALPATAREAPR